ncbi:MAG: hypothetical protein WCJ24_03200 [Candidatus Saccharibacteria bacterium]
MKKQKKVAFIFTRYRPFFFTSLFAVSVPFTKPVIPKSNKSVLNHMDPSTSQKTALHYSTSNLVTYNSIIFKNFVEAILPILGASQVVS